MIPYDASCITNRRGMSRRAKRRTSKQRRRENLRLLLRHVEEVEQAFEEWLWECFKEQLARDHDCYQAVEPFRIGDEL